MRAFLTLFWLMLFGGCNTSQPLHVLGGGAARGIEAAFSPAGDFVAVADERGYMRVFDVQSGKEVAGRSGYSATRRAYCSQRIAFSADSERIAFATSSGAISVWSWRAEPPHDVQAFTGHPTPPVHVTFGPSDRLIAMSGGFEYEEQPAAMRRAGEQPRSSREPLRVIVWDTKFGQELSHWENDEAGGLIAALSPSGERLAAIAIPGVGRRLGETPPSVQLTREILVWETDDGSLVKRFDIQSKALPTHIALSPGGTELFTSGLGEQAAPSLLRNLDAQRVHVVDAHGGIFAPDGQTLSAINNTTKQAGAALPLFGLPLPPPPEPTIRLLQVDVSTGEQLLAREVRTSDETRPLAWTPDLSWFIDTELRLWKLSRR